MSENEEIMNETENETMAAEVEAVETVETEAAEVEAADEVSAEEEAEVVEAATDYDDEELMDKMQKAARLLRSRRFAISKEEEAKAERMANIERAIKLLDLKPKMEQKEMSDLLGMRLRELDGLMAEAEAADLVGRIDDAEGDMRKIVVFAAEDAAEGLVELANKKEKLLPELSYEEATELMAALDKVIAPLVAMGLDEDRGPRGGRDDRGGRGGDRGGRGGFGERGGRGGDRGGRGGDRGGRGGFGDRGIEGMIQAAQYARENQIPYFGICLGMQIMVMEFARGVLGYADANSSEFTPDGAHNVIALMADQQGNIPKGGTMRLGKYPCTVKPGTKMAECYGEAEIWERHRHRYEFNNEFRQEMEDAGLVISGTSPDGRLVETVELPGRDFHLGAQFHPEFKSRPNRAHPLFKGFIAAALKFRIHAQRGMMHV